VEAPAQRDLEGKGLGSQPRPKRVSGNGKQRHLD
jgi:hypothetical protein